MSMTQTYFSVDQYSPKQEKSAHRLLESLERNELRTQSVYNTQRSTPRRSFGGTIEVTLKNPYPVSEEKQNETITVYSADISGGGAGFIYPGEITQSELIVQIPINGRDPLIFKGTIVRRKEIVEEQFWEYGVKFIERLDF